MSQSSAVASKPKKPPPPVCPPIDPESGAIFKSPPKWFQVPPAPSAIAGPPRLPPAKATPVQPQPAAAPGSQAIGAYPEQSQVRPAVALGSPPISAFSKQPQAALPFSQPLQIKAWPGRPPPANAAVKPPTIKVAPPVPAPVSPASTALSANAKGNSEQPFIGPVHMKPPPSHLVNLPKNTAVVSKGKPPPAAPVHGQAHSNAVLWLPPSFDEIEEVLDATLNHIEDLRAVLSSYDDRLQEDWRRTADLLYRIRFRLS